MYKNQKNIPSLRFFLYFFLIGTYLLEGKEYPLLLHDIFSSDYIICDVFKEVCDHEFSTFKEDVNNVKEGDTIFVPSGLVLNFIAKIHPKIKTKYILVTHLGIRPAPGPFRKFLDDEKVYAWFGKNIDFPEHPKMFPLPLGVNNRIPLKEKISALDHVHQMLPIKKENLVILTHLSNTVKERENLMQYFSNIPFITKTKKKPFLNFLQDLATSKFVISPEGAGMDCFRTWETLMTGSYPIVKKSSLDMLFYDLPVLLINNWEEITPEFLEQKYVEMSKKTYDLERLTIHFWVNMMFECKQNCRKGKSAIEIKKKYFPN